MAANVLDGFEVFEPGMSRGELWIGLVISGNIRMTQGCTDVLRDPEYVVAFFDRKGKRLMLVPGKKDTPNCIRVGKQNDTNKSKYINCRSLNDEIRRVAGIAEKPIFTVFGQKVDVVRPTLVFDLGNVSVKDAGKVKREE